LTFGTPDEVLGTHRGWLEQDQLDTLRTIVFSGAIISAATAYFTKRVA
jgi:hypothetical protein